MLDRRFIRKNPDAVREGLKKKGVEFDLDGFLALDEKLRSLIQESDQLKAEKNRVSNHKGLIK